MASRRLRAFNRWMKSQGIEYSDSLDLISVPDEGISVRALCDLHEGDVVAKIPKTACLTIKTTGASELIESAGLDGYLGLSVALMYEKSLGEESPWASYLQLLPDQECLPLVWSIEELDSLLCGTELHKIIKEDKSLVYEDWEESILPLLDSPLLKLNPNFFGVNQYFAAKTLIASRSFEIDDYHGFGMVPLADLFNHKTGAEDVHFTSTSSHIESDDESKDNKDFNDNIVQEPLGDDEASAQNSSLEQVSDVEVIDEESYSDKDQENSSFGDDASMLEMIMVKDVKAGVEVFNTYGLTGNAALLHRYGFTEPNNSYDIVNIDLDLVLKWSSSLYSSRYTRARLALWKKLDYSGCISDDSDYFEISQDGEPEIELLVLLYVMLLPEDMYCKLDIATSTTAVKNGYIHEILSGSCSNKTSESSKDFLLTKSVCRSLIALADLRESLYGSNSISDDIQSLKSSSCIKERKLYHSLVLRVSERKILEKLRNYGKKRIRSLKSDKKVGTRKKKKSKRE